MNASRTLGFISILFAVVPMGCEQKTAEQQVTAPPVAQVKEGTASEVGYGKTPSGSSDQTVVADSWPLPPLLPGDWAEINKQEARDVLDRLQEKLSPDLLDTARQITRIRFMPLSFYPRGGLYEGLVAGSAPGDLRLFTFVILGNGTVKALNGNSAPIYELNESAPLALDTGKCAEAYLRFFDAALFAQDGNFRIIDKVQDLLWARDASESSKQSAAKYVRPLALERVDNGGWKASAVIEYGTSIYNAALTVDSGGKVEMGDEVVLASNLPLRRDAFKGPLRYEIALYK